MNMPARGLALLLCGACLLPGLAAQPAIGPTIGHRPGGADLVAETKACFLGAVAERDFDRAFTILRAARGRGLPLGVYHLFQSKVYAATQDTAAEEQQLRGAIHHDPALTEASLRLGAIMESRGLWLDAADFYRTAIAARPDEVQPSLELARVLLARQRNKSAVDVLEEAAKAAPGDARVPAALGGAYEQCGEMANALAAYVEAARIGVGAVRIRALVKAAGLSLAAGDHRAAFAHYQEAAAAGWESTPAAYGTIAAATDRTSWGVSGAAWNVFEDYIEGKPGTPEREDTYRLIAEALEEQQEIATFLARINPPGEFVAGHAQRRFQCSLLCEALTNAVSYLDTGDEAMIRAGRARRLDALAVRADEA